MIYHILFRLKMQEQDWMTLGKSFQVLWESRDLIAASSGWIVFNQESIAPAYSLIPTLEKGIFELTQRQSDYRGYEIRHGIGTIREILDFYRELLVACEEHPYAELYGKIVA